MSMERTVFNCYGRSMNLFEPYLDFPSLVVSCVNLMDYVENSEEVYKGIRKPPKKVIDSKIRRKFKKIPNKNILFSIKNLVIKDIRDSSCIKKEDHSLFFGFGVIHDVRKVPVSRRDFVLEQEDIVMFGYIQLSNARKKEESWTHTLYSEIGDLVDVTLNYATSAIPHAEIQTLKNNTLMERLSSK